MFVAKNQEGLKKGQIPNEIYKILNNSNLLIERGDYQKYPWVSIFLNIQQIKATEISLYSNEAQINLWAIFTPKFQQLQCMHLSCNQIISVEPFAHLYAPNLKDIKLLTNKINRVRALRKGHFPQLEELDLSRNPIKQPECICEMHLPKLKQFHLEIWPTLPHIGQTKRWLFKLQSPILKQLSVRSRSRLSEPHIDSILKQKQKGTRVT